MKQVAKILESRSKVIAYYWGVKLAKFTKELELIDSKDFPNGYGEILSTKEGFECKYKVHSDEYAGLHEIERKKYSEIITKVGTFIKDRSEVDTAFDETMQNICGS